MQVTETENQVTVEVAPKPTDKALMSKVRVAMEKSRVQLISVEPYYALVLQRVTTRFVDNIETACVLITEVGQAEMWVNPEFFLTLPELQRLGLLQHEAAHLILDHIPHEMASNITDHDRANAAQDMALNQFIRRDWLPWNENIDLVIKGENLRRKAANLPPLPVPCVPELYEGMEMRRSFLYYYEELGKRQPKGGAGSGGNLLDKHNVTVKKGDGKESGKPIEVPDDIKRAIAEAIMKDACEELLNSEEWKGKISGLAGNLPLHVQKYLRGEREAPIKNWREELKRFLSSSVSPLHEHTRARAHRRLGWKAPGKTRTYVPKIGIGCDSSGSVHDAMLTALLSECAAILDEVAGKTEVFFFDTAIAHSMILTEMKTLPERRYAHGGTCFDCAVEHAKKQNLDLLIIATDAEAPAPKEYPKFPILWLIAGKYENPNLKGRQIRIAEHL